MQALAPWFTFFYECFLFVIQGNMEAVGPLSELHDKGIDFASLMKEEEEEVEIDEEIEDFDLRRRTSTKRSIKSQSVSTRRIQNGDVIVICDLSPQNEH